MKGLGFAFHHSLRLFAVHLGPPELDYTHHWAEVGEGGSALGPLEIHVLRALRFGDPIPRHFPGTPRACASPRSSWGLRPCGYTGLGLPGAGNSSRRRGHPIPEYELSTHRFCPCPSSPSRPAAPSPGFWGQMGLKVAAPFPAPPLGPQWLCLWLSAGGRTGACSKGQRPDAHWGGWGGRARPRF